VIEGVGAEFIQLAARSLIKGSLRSELNHDFRAPERQTPGRVRRHATAMLASLHRVPPRDEEVRGDGQEG
jgi:hypothetical protein